MENYNDKGGLLNSHLVISFSIWKVDKCASSSLASMGIVNVTLYRISKWQACGVSTSID